MKKQFSTYEEAIIYKLSHAQKPHRHAPDEETRWNRKNLFTDWRAVSQFVRYYHRDKPYFPELLAVASKVRKHDKARAVALCLKFLTEESLYTGLFTSAAVKVRMNPRRKSHAALLAVCINHMRAISEKYGWD